MGTNHHTAYSGTAFTAAGMGSPLSELDRAITYSRPAIVGCDGTVSWASGTLTWTGSIHIYFNSAAGNAIHNSIAAGSLALSDSEFAYVTLNETNDTVLTMSKAAISTGSASNYLTYNLLVLGYRNASDDNYYPVHLNLTSISVSGLEINQGASFDQIKFKSSNINHGMTDITPTDVYAFLRRAHDASGGFYVNGMTDGDVTGLFLEGMVGTDTPTAAGTVIGSAKKSGTTDQAFAAKERCIAFMTFLTTLGYFTGDGTFNVTKLATAQGANIASASTVDLTSATGNLIHITGTTGITSFGTDSAGAVYALVFDGVLTITHNATSLICPGGVNITTVAGARMIVASEGSGNWRVLYYADQNLATTANPQFASIELGHASDTTISRVSAGVAAVEGKNIYTAGGADVAVADGGTGTSTLTDHGILLGSGTDAITPMTALAAGEIVVGVGGADPHALAAGATTKILVGGGAADPVWTEATGSGAPVRATSPTLVTPVLDTPTSGDLRNCSAATDALKGVVELATNAETLAGTDTSRAVTPDDLKYVLDRRIQQYYGVSWNESADTYVRTGSTAGQTCGVTLADAFLPVHRRMRGCLVADDGTVNYYLCATDWAYKEGPAYATGTITSDGTIPSDGDTVTIGNKTYTFKSALTPTEGEVLIAGSAAAAMQNLQRAIEHTGTPNTDYKCAAHHTQVNASYDSLVVTVVSLLGGTVGNGYGLAVSDANMAVSAANMAGGAVNAASDLTGTDGQVMVEIPKFWYRYGYSGTTHTWEVSPVPLTGFKVHEMFMSDTTEKDYVYIGAYEASLYDVSASKYVGQCYQTSVSAVFATSDDSITIATRTGWATALAVGQKLVITGTSNNNTTVTVKTIESATKITVDENLTDETAATTVIQTQTDVTDTTGDKLCSVSGVCPITGGSVNGTRAHFRTWAENRGGGKAANDAAAAQWSQLYGDGLSALQLLYLTEYASFYSQSVLGYGIAAVANWPAYNDSNPIAKSGNGNAIGNISGCTATSAITTGAGATSVYLKYRGIENLYGHLWKFIDGYKVNNNIPYLCNNFSNFSDAESTNNYTNPTDVNGVAITMYNDTGYQGTLELTGRGFFPASLTGGLASAKITDYYSQDSGWRVARSGGGADRAAVAGAFYLSADGVLAGVYRVVGGRLVCRK